MLFSVDTTVRGRFSEKRCGPSRRCARNASAALENFVCYPQKTFSTASTRSGHAAYEYVGVGAHFSQAARSQSARQQASVDRSFGDTRRGRQFIASLVTANAFRF